MDTIIGLVRRAWWRLVAVDVLRTFSVTLTVGAVVVVGWRMVSSVAPAPVGWLPLLGVTTGAALVSAVIWSVSRVRRGGAVARELDERAGLRESLSTALCVAGSDDPWSRAAVAQAERVAAGVSVSRAIPVEAPAYWPAPAAAVAIAGLALVLPAPDLRGLFTPAASGPAPAELAVVEARAEVDEAVRSLEEEARRLGVELGLEDLTESGEIGAPDELTPEAIRAEAVKKLTKLTDTLAEKLDTPEQRAAEAIGAQLQRLRQPGPGPAQDLARAMARGEFGKARDELSELAEQLRSGELGEEDRAKLAEQMENLSAQLEALAERQGDLERALREGGLSAEQAAKLAQQLAADPGALKQAMEQMQGLSESQRQQLAELAQRAASSSQAAQSMSNAMSQMASAMSGQGQQGMSGEMSAAMDALGDQLSQMEMAQGELASMRAMLASAQGQCKGLCEGSAPGLGEWGAGDSQREGSGSGGPGRGHGASPDARETSVTTTSARSAVKTTDGPIIGSTLVYESQVRGESRAAFAAAARSATASASDAIESMRVPREYERAVMRYFGALEAKSKGGSGGGSEAGDGSGSGGSPADGG